jgi:hypothetical protein
MEEIFSPEVKAFALLKSPLRFISLRFGRNDGGVEKLILINVFRIKIFCTFAIPNFG